MKFAIHSLKSTGMCTELDGDACLSRSGRTRRFVSAPGAAQSIAKRRCVAMLERTLASVRVSE
jgi:hypothetical protein